TSHLRPGEGRRRITMESAWNGHCAVLIFCIQETGLWSQDRMVQESGRMKMSVRLSVVVAAAAAAVLTAAAVSEVASQSKPTLDYEVFKSKVEPIFLER